MSGSILATQTAPVTIDFTEIPANLEVPGTYIEVAANYDQSGLVAYPARVLMLAPILPTGTAPPLRPVQIFTPQQAAELFGANGIGAAMAAAFIAANPWTPLYMMAVPTPSGATAATWTVTCQAVSTLSGPSGTLSLYIGDQQVSVPYTAGVDTGSTLLTALMNAVNATPGLPVTASNSTSANFTLTALDKGAIANSLIVQFNQNPGDVIPGGQTGGVNNLNTGVALTSGTGVHSVANALAAIPSSWYTHIICPWTDTGSLTALATELDRRFGAMVGLDARAFSFISSNNLTNLLAAVNGQNSRFMSILGLQNEPTAPWIVAAQYGAVCAFNLVNDPARQLRGLALPAVKAPASVDRLTETERQQMLTQGLATATVGKDGVVRIERAVTTYQYAAGQVPDTAWQDIMTAETASRIRYDWINYIALTYPRNKMAADGSLAAEYDPTIVTPRRMSGAWAARSRLYEQLGWIQNSAQTAAQSVFQLDASNPNRMNARMQYQQIGNLMVLAGQLQFSLNGQQSSTAQG